MQHLSFEEHGAVSRYLCARETLNVITLCHLALSKEILGQLRRSAWRAMSETARVHYLARSRSISDPLEESGLAAGTDPASSGAAHRKRRLPISA